MEEDLSPGAAGMAEAWMQSAHPRVRLQAQGLSWGADPVHSLARAVLLLLHQGRYVSWVCSRGSQLCSHKEIHFLPSLQAVGCSLLLGGALKLTARAVGLRRAEAGCVMLSSGLPPVVLLLAVLELSSDAGASLSNEEKKIILDGHNKYRSQVSPPAMDMLKMVSGF